MNEVLIREFAELRHRGPFRIRVRVIRVEGRRPATYLDLRAYVESAAFTGWTRKGLRLSTEEFETLLKLAPDLQRVLREHKTRLRRNPMPGTSTTRKKDHAR